MSGWLSEFYVLTGVSGVAVPSEGVFLFESIFRGPGSNDIREYSGVYHGIS